MNKERFLASGLMEQYVLGLTTPEEAQEVERYAQAFPEVQAEIDSLREAMEQYAAQYAVPPSPKLKEKIITEIDMEQQSLLNNQRSSAGRGLRIASTLLTALLLIAGIAILRLISERQELQHDYDRLATDFTIFRDECDKVQKAQQASQQIFAFLNHSATQVIHLIGTDLDTEAHVVVYWNEHNQQAYLKMLNMPEPPPGKQYQIWADVNGEMIDAGLLENQTDQLQSIDVIANAESLNITIEPIGGSEHPTVEFLLVNGKV